MPEGNTLDAYLVGLIDSDGFITRTDRRSNYWHVNVSIMDKEVIGWLANIRPAGTVHSQQRTAVTAMPGSRPRLPRMAGLNSWTDGSLQQHGRRAKGGLVPQ